MFKKVLQSISKSLSRQTEAPTPAPAPRPSNTFNAPPPPAAKAGQVAGIVAAKSSAPKTPEGLLGIEPKMSKEQIREHLKLMYRRYNRAASSLDNNTRSEADSMLEAIVAVREKHFGQI
ncbi:MAG: hypothetical protein JWO08_4771 [Verrucomicrobiaceae bacterium]|nr:hypothetical protein [Verrucomicrobiaceae bacterium]